MRKVITHCAMYLGFALAALAILLMISGCATHAQRAKLLSVGMTESQVRYHLGQPDTIDDTGCRAANVSCSVRWHYGKTKVTLRAASPAHTRQVSGWGTY